MTEVGKVIRRPLWSEKATVQYETRFEKTPDFSHGGGGKPESSSNAGTKNGSMMPHVAALQFNPDPSIEFGLSLEPCTKNTVTTIWRSPEPYTMSL